MNWKELLSTKRQYESAAYDGDDLRSEFEKDYHRIIESAPFRRLQDKTQVFPLDKSDFIRTRLTHSLEVSSLCRSLGQNISKYIISNGIDETFDDKAAEEAIEILQCAGLIHDIGNPPFGHFGEEAIRDWFEKNLDSLVCQGEKVKDILNEEELLDFRRFEGNAQGLRLVTKLHSGVSFYGMNLTYGLLSCMIKYPVDSTGVSGNSEDIKLHKTGYFEAEKDLFYDIAETTGTGSRRNPLTFILEAADDIAYSTADIEDAMKKGFIDYELLCHELKVRGVSEDYIDRLKNIYTLSVDSGNIMPQEGAIMKWLSEMQEVLIAAATRGFANNYKELMEGTYKYPIIHGGEGEKLLNALKRIAFDYAFTSDSIFRTEIAANTMLTYILDCIVPASLQYGCEKPAGLMEEKYITLISRNYRQIYDISAKDKPENVKTYLRIMLATDFVSGMTDSYARDLYEELHGRIH